MGLTEAGAKDPDGLANALLGRFLNHCGAHIADESLPFPCVIDALKE